MKSLYTGAIYRKKELCLQKNESYFPFYLFIFTFACHFIAPDWKCRRSLIFNNEYNFMNIRTTLRRFFRQQKYLYFWSLFLLLLPCFFLALTDYLPVAAWLAALLIPAGCYMLLMLLFGRPGYAVLLLSAIFFMSGTQLVFIYLFGGGVIASDMFLNLATTNTSESGELINTIWPLILTACLVYLPPLGWAAYSVVNRCRLSHRFTAGATAAGIIFIIAGVSAGISMKKQNPDYRFVTAIYPVNVLNNIRYAAHKLWNSSHYQENVADFRFHAVKERKAPEREIYVLVIGETSRAANWSLYGYGRNTNPLLSREENLLVFRDVLTQGNITHRIVPMILSAASAEDFNVIYRQKSLITAFKEAGFTTVFISNQTPNRSFIDFFAAEADKDISILPMQAELGRPTYDTDMLPLIREFLTGTEDNLLLVLHTYGSHFEYNGRYPAEFSVFRPDHADRLSEEFRDRYVNAYDNTIHYIDYFLHKVIGELKETNACSALLYLSDHGEDLMDDSRNMFLHCSPNPSYYQLHIPFLCWMSDGYKKVFPDKVARAEKHVTAPIASNAVFHSFIDLAGIATHYMDSTYSVFSHAFREHPRHFISDHDAPVDIRDLRLRKEDIEMMRKYNLKY